MINNYPQPIDFLIPDDIWWFVFEEETKQIISSIQFPGKRGCLSSPHILITADTKEELEEYIQENNLILPKEKDDNYFPTYNIE